MAACPDDRCDGSGFLYDEATRRARACSCRPQRIARRRAAAVAGRLPKRFREVSFEREPVISILRTYPHIATELRGYVSHVSARLEEGRGIWFAGKVGTGKTTLAMLVSKTAMEANHTVAIYSLPRLLAMLRDTYADDAEYSITDLIDRLCSVDLLHIDDVGAEQTSPWVLEQLYTIINTRYEDGRAVLLTTNLDDAQLRVQIGDRTVSRIYEMCGNPLPMMGDDKRKPDDFVLPDAAPAPARGPGRWRDEDAFWEHGGSAPAARAYGRPRDGAD